MFRAAFPPGVRDVRGGKCSRSVNAYGVGPNSRRCSTRPSASAVVGVCPPGIHHSAAYASAIRSNHCRTVFSNLSAAAE